MESLYKVCAIALIVMVINQVLKIQGKSDIAKLINIVGVVAGARVMLPEVQMLILEFNSTFSMFIESFRIF